MTPWGIRNRIKSVLGRGPSAKPDERVALTLILPEGRESKVQCEPGYTLVMASQSLETPIATHCPDGHCGECRVEVVDATGLKEPSSAESRLIQEKGYAATTRLACHAKVAGSGARVKVRNVWTMDSVKGT